MVVITEKDINDYKANKPISAKKKEKLEAMLCMQALFALIRGK